MTGLSEHFDDISIRRVIVAVSEIATVVEMVTRVNPFVDPDQDDSNPVPQGLFSRDQDLTKLLANSRR